MEHKLSSGKTSLLKRYDIPVEHLSYDYIDKCCNGKELEKIVKILRSGEEGMYLDLLNYAENKLATIKPQSSVLQKEGTLLKKGMVRQDEWNKISDDMKEWTECMKAVDKDLQRKDLALRELPPVRGSKSQTIPTVQEIQKSQEVEKPPPKLKSCIPRSYSEWDAFDPEKELMKMEIAEEKEKEELAKKKRLSQTDIKDETVEAKRMMVNTGDENLTTQEKEIMALKEKEKGNEFYHAKDFKKAVICYTTSIKLNPSVAAYNNRAMSYLSLENYPGVVKDCDYVLKYEPENIKALWRRGNAYLKLNKFTQAYGDLDHIVRLDPKNQNALKLCRELEERLFPDKKPVRIPIQEGNSPKKSQKIVELSSTETKVSTGLHNKSYKNAKLVKSITKIDSSSASNEIGPSEVLEIRLENSDKPDSYLVPLKDIVPKVNRWGQVRYDCPSRNTPLWLPERFPKCVVCEIEGRPPDYNCQQHRTPLKVPSMEVDEDQTDSDTVTVEENKTTGTLSETEGSSMEVECTVNVTEMDNNTSEKESTDGNSTEKQGVSKEPNKPESLPVSKSNSTGTVSLTYRPSRRVHIAKKYEKCHETKSTPVLPETKSTPVLPETKSTPVLPEPAIDQATVISPEEPCSPFEFTMKWEALKHCTELTEHAKLLSIVKPDELPRALGTKMDGDMLKKILHCLDKYYATEENAQLLLNYLEHLTKVERFSTVLLFLSNPDRKVISKLFDVLKKFNCVVPYHVTKAYFP